MSVFRTTESDFDKVRLGWKFKSVAPKELQGLTADERRNVYDARQDGCRNTGHTYGDHFTVDERRAVVEYLKTL